MIHVHKYHRIYFGRNKLPIYRCMLPSCSHYVQEEFILNRESICWSCGKIFVISRKKKRKPVCEECRKKLYKTKEENVVEDIISKIMREKIS